MSNLVVERHVSRLMCPAGLCWLGCHTVPQNIVSACSWQCQLRSARTLLSQGMNQDKAGTVCKHCPKPHCSWTCFSK